MSGESLIEEIKRYVRFGAEEERVLSELLPHAEPHFSRLAAEFYDRIREHERAHDVFTGEDQVERLKRSLVRWMRRVCSGPYDEAYFAETAKIGRMHVRVGLPQVYMFTAMALIRVAFVRIAEETMGERRQAAREAVTRVLDLELAIMLETYRDDLLTKNRTAERLATIGQFAASIGHELRNPLGVVESSAFLISRRLEQLNFSDPGVIRHMEKITNEVQRSGKTINDLLELAKNRPLNRQQVDTHDFVVQAIAAAHLGSSVAVSVDVPAGVPLDADPDQLTRVVTNLLINASQAMNGSGHIWIDGQREGTTTTLRIRDDGPGVPAEVRDRIFEALFTTKAKGSGLGLALCRRIVEAHGGTIVLEASERGAMFKIIVPDSAG